MGRRRRAVRGSWPGRALSGAGRWTDGDRCPDHRGPHRGDPRRRGHRDGRAARAGAPGRVRRRPPRDRPGLARRRRLDGARRAPAGHRRRPWLRALQRLRGPGRGGSVRAADGLAGHGVGPRGGHRGGATNAAARRCVRGAATPPARRAGWGSRSRRQRHVPRGGPGVRAGPRRRAGVALPGLHRDPGDARPARADRADPRPGDRRGGPGGRAGRRRRQTGGRVDHACLAAQPAPRRPTCRVPRRRAGRSTSSGVP